MRQIRAQGAMSCYELCMDTDRPGNGELFDALSDAKSTGWERVGHSDALEDLTEPRESFFTVHEVDADGDPAVVVFDSRNDLADG
jgi:hypothetical protein